MGTVKCFQVLWKNRFLNPCLCLQAEKGLMKSNMLFDSNSWKHMIQYLLIFIRNSLVLNSDYVGMAKGTNFRKLYSISVINSTLHLSYRKLRSLFSRYYSQELLAHILMSFVEDCNVPIMLFVAAADQKHFNLSLPCLFPDVDVFQHLSSARWNCLQRWWYCKNSAGFIDSHAGFSLFFLKG